MGYKQEVRAIKCDTLREAKEHRLGCYGLSLSKITVTKDDSGEYDLVDLILSDLDEEKFSFSISKSDLERAMNS